MPSIVLMTVWWTVGAPTMILLAGLKQISPSYLEAAAIDGATGPVRFFRITLPLLRPVFLFVLVTYLIGAFQVFGQTWMITSGGPELTTQVLVHYIYNVAFNARTSLNQLFGHLRDILGRNGVAYAREPRHADFRAGDVRHSQADIAKARGLLGYEPQFDILRGLEVAMPWYVQFLS